MQRYNAVILSVIVLHLPGNGYAAMRHADIRLHYV